MCSESFTVIRKGKACNRERRRPRVPQLDLDGEFESEDLGSNFLPSKDDDFGEASNVEGDGVVVDNDASEACESSEGCMAGRNHAKDKKVQVSAQTLTLMLLTALLSHRLPQLLWTLGTRSRFDSFTQCHSMMLISPSLLLAAHVEGHFQNLRSSGTLEVENDTSEPRVRLKAKQRLHLSS